MIIYIIILLFLLALCWVGIIVVDEPHKNLFRGAGIIVAIVTVVVSTISMVPSTV